MKPLLILRPRPGADASAAAARALGLEPVVAPLFTLVPVAWDPPAPDAVEAVMMTSANAPRLGGAALARFAHLPCYAVGAATAAAARDAGYSRIETGETDGVALVARIVADGVRSVLHFSGRDHVGLAHPDLSILRRVVYAADPVADLPAAAQDALHREACVLLHSPRAAQHFAMLADEAGIARGRIAIVAISAAAARAAGEGWGAMRYAALPRDAAMLELARELCKTAPCAETERDGRG
ncbi:uroporphyrinogen-III synthase [Allosphingosinicella humi]